MSTNSHPELIPALATVLHGALALAASGHIILTKRDVRGATGWIGLVWLSPYIGTVLYALFGINRIQRKAIELRRDQRRHAPRAFGDEAPTEELASVLGQEAAHLGALVKFMANVSGRPLIPDNAITALVGGKEAYPAMLKAIDGARRSIGLASYIFNYDAIGSRFVEALAAARARGVEVRVLVDAVGARYHRPSIIGPLREAGITADLFLPSLVPSYFPYFNLRNHRKILVVDGREGFTGGMNIDQEFDEDCCGTEAPRADLHFALKGPIVDSLREIFAEDWAFRTGELLDGPAWMAEPVESGDVLARALVDGPDNNRDTLAYAFLGGLNAARDRVSIITPYFLPDARLVAALSAASMRGVTVEIFLPKVGNLGPVQWASTAMLWQVLEHGCEVWYVPPPFDHTKLMLVDGCWSFIGSGNWDPRSLRLNFEFNVECYDRPLAARLGELVQRRRKIGERVTLEHVDSRPLPIRLRDGTARLFSPYL